ncbi:hypothetical protein NJB1728f31_26580, partial [Mycobacterium marinum]
NDAGRAGLGAAPTGSECLGTVGFAEANRS